MKKIKKFKVGDKVRVNTAELKGTAISPEKSLIWTIVAMNGNVQPTHADLRHGNVLFQSVDISEIEPIAERHRIGSIVEYEDARFTIIDFDKSYLVLYSFEEKYVVKVEPSEVFLLKL